MRILIVEDDVTSRMLMKKILEPYGECEVAANGRLALAAFDAAWAAGRPFDLITLDIMMPEINGQEVLREIRKREEGMNIHGAGGVKVIMTTALDDNENIMTAFTCQCEAYIVKPVDKSLLLTTIESLGLAG